MILVDHQIRAAVNATRHAPLVITPFNDEQVRPASYDIRLGTEVLSYNHRYVASAYRSTKPLDPHKEPDGYTKVSFGLGEEWELPPGEFVLCSTIEHIKLPNNIRAQIDGRSTFGRLGVTVHVTAGYIDPGFEGDLTLEIANLNCRGVIMRPGDRIAQLSFMVVAEPDRPYGHPDLGSHYHNQRGVTPPAPLEK